MARIITLASVRRSGCHPVAQWMGTLIGSNVPYCHNNVGYITDYIRDGEIINFSGTATSPEIDPASVSEENLASAFFVANSGESLLTRYSEHKDMGNGDLMEIYDLSDFPKDSFVVFGSENRAIRDVSTGSCFSDLVVMNIRDPFNVWASTVAYAQARSRSTNQRMVQTTLIGQPKNFLTNPAAFSDLWGSYALEYIGETNYLTGAVKSDYNKWLVDEEYREELAQLICNKLDLDIDIEASINSGRENVPIHGGGSSFDGVNGKDRDYTERWRQMLDNVAWKNVIHGNRPLFELAGKIWPDLTQQVEDELNRG